MDLGLQNKVALVTGASKGIGYAIAKGLVSEGVRVVINGRDDARLQQAIDTLRRDVLSEQGQSGQSQSGKGEQSVVGFAADVSRPDEIERLMGFVEETFGLPDILVSNAGGPPAGLATALADESWEKGYDLTLMANVRLSRLVLPHMRSQRWGRIINITSVSIKQPVANLTLSNAFRSAVTGFAKTLSAEIASDGVTVNNVAPGYTATQRLTDLFKDEDAKNAVRERIPAKRFALPEEVAAAAVFLASQQAAYMTGQTLVVDGGVVGATY